MISPAGSHMSRILWPSGVRIKKRALPLTNKNTELAGVPCDAITAPARKWHSRAAASTVSTSSGASPSKNGDLIRGWMAASCAALITHSTFYKNDGCLGEVLAVTWNTFADGRGDVARQHIQAFYTGWFCDRISKIFPGPGVDA